MKIRPFICIPTYNNPKTLKDIVRRTLACSKLNVLVVNDGSSFNVESELKEFLNSRLELIQFKKNYGKGKALQAGLSWGLNNNFTHMISLDSDGQLFPEDLPKFELSMHKNPWALILGKRIFESNVPESSKFGRKFSNFWVKLETGKQAEDTQTGFRVYPLFWAQNIKSKSHRFNFEISAISEILNMGAPLTHIDCKVSYPDDRVSHFNKLRDNILLTVTHTHLCTLAVLRKLFFWQTKKQKKTWSGKSGGNQLGFKIFKWALKFLGLKTAYGLLFFVIPYYYLLVPRTRKTISNYRKLISPKETSLKRQISIICLLFRYGQCLIDQFAFRMDDQSTWKFDKTGFSEIHELDSAKILLGAHIGSWYLARFLIQSRYGKTQLKSVEYVNPESFHKKTGMENNNSIAVNSGQWPILDIADFLKKKKPLSFLIDRPVSKKIELVPFFGKIIPLETTPFKLVRLPGFEEPTPLFYFSCVRKGFKHYSILIKKIDSIKPEEAMSEWLSLYKEIIKKHPDQWFNFHELWKTLPEGIFTRIQDL